MCPGCGEAGPGGGMSPSGCGGSESPTPRIMASMSSPSGSVGGRGFRTAMYRSNSMWYFVAWLVVPQIVHGPPAPVQRRGWTRRQ